MTVSLAGGAQRGIIPLKKGNLTANGSEQTLVEYEGPSRVTGYVNLSQMQLGDGVTITEYAKTSEAGAYGRHATETYGDVQTLPLLHIVSKPGSYGLKVTLRQTAGVFRSFENAFWLEG